MSWIVRNLILDSYIILSKVNKTEVSPIRWNLPRYGDIEYDDVQLLYTENDDIFDENIVYTVMDVENDEYTFFREMVEKIKELVSRGQISELEYNVIRLLSEGNSYKEVAKKLEISRDSARKIFNTSCNKIAFSLGGVFTDEGYAEYITKKYSLKEEELEKIMKLLESHRRL